jgi:phospholipase/carboxylesterase
MQIAYAANRLHLLSGRFGPRPRSSVSLPFRQLDQFPPENLQRRLIELSSEMPHVHVRQSRLASPGCLALCINDGVAAGPVESFIDGHEFCHVHALPEGCIHTVLPPSTIEVVVALGWAERHPVHRLGLMETLVMIYAPRDEAELDVVISLMECARQFAIGAPSGVAVALSLA